MILRDPRATSLYWALLEIAIELRCEYIPDERQAELSRLRWQEYARAVKPS